MAPPLAKQCRVCGDQALAFNFNGLSCESCKSFFRRMAVRSKALKCKLTGSCLIDKFTRRYCKHCRLQKCYAIGMKKEMIRSNRQCQPQSKLGTKGENCEQVSRELVHLKTYDYERIREVHQAMRIFASSSRESESPDRSERGCPLVTTASGESPETVAAVLNLSAGYVRKAIKFSKQFSSFRELTSADQLVLLKGAFPEVAAVYIAAIYDPVADAFPVFVDESGSQAVLVKVDYSGQMTRKDASAAFRRFISRLNAQLAGDVVLRDLIIAGLLFKERHALSCPEYIRYNHAVYIRLLRQYMSFKCARGNGHHHHHQQERNCGQGCWQFEQLMELLGQVDQVAELMRAVFTSEVEPGQLVDVLLEIFDIRI